MKLDNINEKWTRVSFDGIEHNQMQLISISQQRKNVRSLKYLLAMFDAMVFTLVYNACI